VSDEVIIAIVTLRKQLTADGLDAGTGDPAVALG
jgi:hypothetical protein